LLQGARVPPIAAAVDHPRIEHALVEIVADVVVLLADLERPARGLSIDDVRLRGEQDFVDRADLLLGGDAEDAIEHLVELVAIPLPVHVRLAHAERALPQRSPVERLVMHAHVPGIRASYRHPRSAQQRFDGLTTPRHLHSRHCLPVVLDSMPQQNVTAGRQYEDRRSLAFSAQARSRTMRECLSFAVSFSKRATESPPILPAAGGPSYIYMGSSRMAERS